MSETSDPSHLSSALAPSVCLQVLVPWLPRKASARIIVLKWYYNKEEQACQLFWFGNCGAVPTSLKPEKKGRHGVLLARLSLVTGTLLLTVRP